jgi:hypothetical protein
MKPILALESLYGQLKQVPTPNGITSKEIVVKAIEFENPPRIPYTLFFYPTRGDLFDFFFAKWLRRKPKVKDGFYTDEWGVVWKDTGYWWGTAVKHPLADLANLSDYKFPNPIPKGTFLLLPKVAKLARRKKKYIVAPNLITMYERMRSLMGFVNLMLAPYNQPDKLEKLLDILADMTINLITKYSTSGLFDAFMTWEDWGLQSRLQMRIDTFKQFYKPIYKRIIDTVHENGMHFIWHSCGDITELIPEMIDLGVDVVQIDQPRLLGHQKLIESLGGKMCMWNTVDIQWSNQAHITNKDIVAEIKSMIAIYDVKKYRGGFIFRNYPDPEDINISEKRQRFINSTFLQYL